MAAAVGVEPTTLRFEAERSIQLSYAAVCLRLPPTLLEKSDHGRTLNQKGPHLASPYLRA